MEKFIGAMVYVFVIGFNAIATYGIYYRFDAIKVALGVN